MKQILLILTATLLISTVEAQILSESFEGTAAAAGWTQEQFGTTAIWYEGNGPFMGTSTPPDGTKYAGYWGDAGLATSLITPVLNLSAAGNDTLTFYYALRTGATLELFYKTSAAGTWVPISASLPATSTWTYKEVHLPNPNSTYYLAFKCTSIGSDDGAVDMVNIYDGAITTEINNKKENLNLNIMPNPSNGKFNIVMDESSNLRIKTLDVFNLVGELIFSTKPTAITTSIDISNQPNGIYFVKAETTDGFVISSKVVKSY